MFDFPIHHSANLNLLGFSLCYVLFILIYFINLRRKRKNDPTERIFLNLAFIFYFLCVAYLVWLPLEIMPTAERSRLAEIFWGTDLTLLQIMNVRLVPFHSIYVTLYAPWQLAARAIIGNILLLFPLPFFLGLLSEEKITFKKAIFSVFITSLTIELSQLCLNLITGWPNRSVLIDDVILNTLGGILGWLVFSKLEHKIKNLLRIFFLRNADTS